MAIWRTQDLAELLTSPPRTGETTELTFEVSEEMLTRHITDGPAVLSTPALIGLMETAASAVLRPRLASGAATVGTWIGVRHRAPAVLGDQVHVRAELARVLRAHITFDVTARVGDRVIGDGEITQTLVRVS
jgi:fluoroacetyl-CoA thioesterase